MAVIRTSLPELEQAILATLKASTPLVALVTLIADAGAVPVNQTFPYIDVNMGHETPKNAFGNRGYEARPTLNIYSNYRGYTECYTILNLMNGLLDQANLTLANHHLVYFLYDDAFPLNAPGLDNIRQLSVRYKTFTQEH